jgi:DNA modification methylase
MSADARILVGDVRESLRGLPDGCVQTVVTSPPYWGLRDYGHDGQIGLEPTPQEFIENLCQVFDEVWRVLADDGTLWVNLGDSYFSTQAGGGNAPSRKSTLTTNGGKGPKPGDKYEANRLMPSRRVFPDVKPKDLVGIPWRFAFAMQDRGWYLRQDIIWAKPNPMPESVTDRCTKAHEYVFLLTKQPRYYYDHEAVREPLSQSTIRIHSSAGVNARGSGADWKQYNTGNGHSGLVNGNLRDGQRNKRSVWTVTTKPFRGAHFAVMPEALAEPCVLAGSAGGDTVLDPFSGSGTVGVVALRHGRNYIGCELNPEYADLSRKRILDDQPLMNTVEVQA